MLWGWSRLWGTAELVIAEPAPWEAVTADAGRIRRLAAASWREQCANLAEFGRRYPGLAPGFDARLPAWLLDGPEGAAADRVAAPAGLGLFGG